MVSTQLLQAIHWITDCKTCQQQNLAVSGRFYQCHIKNEHSWIYLSWLGKCLKHSQVIERFLSRHFCQKFYHTFVLLTARILRVLRPIIKILLITKWIKITNSDCTNIWDIQCLLRMLQSVIWCRCFPSNKINLYPCKLQLLALTIMKNLC